MDIVNRLPTKVLVRGSRAAPLLKLIAAKRKIGPMNLSSAGFVVRRVRNAFVGLLAVVGVSVVTYAPAVRAGDLVPLRLRANALVEPMVIDTSRLTFSWQLQSRRANEAQSGYQVRVRDQRERTVWDSGKVASTAQSVVYAGQTLQSRDRLSWKIRAWDADGRVSDWSRSAQLETGLLQAKDWKAQWIDSADTHRLPLIARDFTLDKPVARARLYAVGLGVFEARLNGLKLGDAVLEPADTDYRKRINYSIYDVTALLRRGANTLGFLLGNGIYNVPPTSGRYEKFSGSQGSPKLLAQLEVTFTDGTMAIIASDTAWRTTAGPITFSNWYGGEDDDKGADPVGWDAPGFDRSGWSQAALADRPTGILHAQEAPPVRVQEELTALSVTSVRAGTWLYDMGRNIAGWPRIVVRDADGQTVKIVPGEKLDKGRVDQSDSGGPMYYRYKASGNAPQSWSPRFTYTGFRYLEISGLTRAPAIADVRADVLRADNPRIGSFSSSDSRLNKIHEMVVRAVESNMMSILTDCPHREKFGWLEETHLLYDTLAANFDVQAATTQWMDNLLDAQLGNGSVPSIAPEYVVLDGPFRDDPNWGGAIVMMAYKAYRDYGDVAWLRSYYPAMQRYMDYLASKANADGVLDYGLADWGAIDNSTSPAITATTAWYRYVMAMQDIAQALGDRSGAARYGKLAETIRAAFNAMYFDAQRGRYGSSQAANALALAAGMPLAGTWRKVADEHQAFAAQRGATVRYGSGARWVSKTVNGSGPCSDTFFGHDPAPGIAKRCELASDNRTRVLAALEADIAARGTHWSTGEIGLRALLDALGDAGKADLVLDMVLNPTQPSYRFMIDSGATTLWEYWNGASSRNHFMLGAIDDWFYRYLGGIQGTGAGFKTFTVAPLVPRRLDSVSAMWPTSYGNIISSWSRDRGAGTFTLQVTVPVGTTAVVHMPLLGADGAMAPPGARFKAIAGDAAIYSVGSGTWTFNVSPGRPTALRHPDKVNLASSTASRTQSAASTASSLPLGSVK